MVMAASMFLHTWPAFREPFKEAVGEEGKQRQTCQPNSKSEQDEDVSPTKCPHQQPKD